MFLAQKVSFVLGQRTPIRRLKMKSQDLLLLFKLISLEQREKLQQRLTGDSLARESIMTLNLPENWRGWDDPIEEDPPARADSYSVRALEASLGVSKTEVAAALKRCQDVGLLRLDPQSQLPRVNSKSLLAFVEHGLRFVFPARPAEITRGIPTGFAAPVLAGKLMSGGDSIHVWPDAYGNRKGQSVKPLFRTVPGAVKKDPLLYEYLALVDAVRMGSPREVQLANEMLREKVLQS